MEVQVSLSTFFRKKICIIIYIVPISLSGQMVHDGSRGNSLSSARRTLDQAERPLQYCFHSVNLQKVVKNKKNLKN